MADTEAVSLLFAGETEFSLGQHPDTGRKIRVLQGPYGWYLELAPPAAEPLQPQHEASAIGLNGKAQDATSKALNGKEPNGKGSTGAPKKRGKAKAPKPQRVSLGKLPAGQVPEVTLEEAVELLRWPKVLSFFPSCDMHAQSLPKLCTQEANPILWMYLGLTQALLCVCGQRHPLAVSMEVLSPK